MSERKLAVEYHDHLNPKVWEGKDGKTLKPEVRKKCLEIAKEFEKFCDTPLDVKDIVLIGSNANYNWNPTSDLDIHILCDIKKLKSCENLTREFFDVKNKKFKEQYDIRIYGLAIEVTVQDIKMGFESDGVYSLIKGKWLHEPKYSPPHYDEDEAIKISDEWKDKINSAMKKPNASHKTLQKVKDDLKKLRQSGLNRKGEFDEKNIAFKDLRRTGVVEKLKNMRDKKLKDELSLKEGMIADIGKALGRAAVVGVIGNKFKIQKRMTKHINDKLFPKPKKK
jgi:predicted nucleotidyltransferase